MDWKIVIIASIIGWTVGDHLGDVVFGTPEQRVAENICPDAVIESRVVYCPDANGNLERVVY